MMNPPALVLLPVESAELTEPALEVLARLSSAFRFELLLLQVWEPLPFTPPEASFYDEGHLISYRKAAEARGRQILEEVARRAAALGLSLRAQLVESGDPAPTILSAAEQHHAEWIVMVSHQRHALSRWVLGSVAEKVAAGASCPVLTIPNRA